MIASTTASALLGLLFAMLAMHYILRNGDRVSHQIADVVPPRPAYTAALVAEFSPGRPCVRGNRRDPMALVMHLVVVEGIMHRFTLLAAIAATALAAGCFGTVGYSAGVSSEGHGPDLVYAAPGVRVIADYDEPIFFADSLYWRFDGVRWYRSSYYTGGWSYATPPTAVLRIDRPRNFVHYRPRGWVARRAQPQGPTARDHRGETRRPASNDRDHRPAPNDDDRHERHQEPR